MPEAAMIVVFDTDGTLLHSVSAHQGALLDAYRGLGVEIGERPLGSFPDHTDSAIYGVLVEEVRGLPATQSDFAQLDAALGEEYHRRVEESVPAEIAGARELLAALERDPRFLVTFATGSMRGVAIQKLEQLGVEVDRARLVTASEHLTREEIVTAAIELADADADLSRPVISIGDGIWDMRTAANLGLLFVAVDSGTYDFAASGVHIVSDLFSLDPDRLFALGTETALAAQSPNNHKESH